MIAVTIWTCPLGIPCSNLGLSFDAFTQMLHFFPQSLQVNSLIAPPRPPTSELFPVFRTGTWRCTVSHTDEILQQTAKETWSSLKSTSRAHVCCIPRSWNSFNLWKLAGASVTHCKWNFSLGLTDWLTDWLADWLADWLIDWRTDWLTGWLTDWLADWLIDWLAGWLTDWLAGWLTGLLTDWLAGWLARWITNELANWLTDWLAA